MNENKFDTKKLQKLNNPQRLADISPDYIWEKLNIKEPGVIVDIGAGTGFFSVAFLEKSKSSKIYACDSSEVMIEWMKENLTQEHSNIIPVKIRYLPEQVKKQLVDAEFKKVEIYDNLQKHFLVVSKKD